MYRCISRAFKLFLANIPTVFLVLAFSDAIPFNKVPSLCQCSSAMPRVCDWTTKRESFQGLGSIAEISLSNLA